MNTELQSSLRRQPSRSKLYNSMLYQGDSKMVNRRKKMDPSFRPFDWLSSIELRKLPFYPQIGDEVMYFRQGYELYLNTVKQKKLYEITSISLPWSKQIIGQQELVRIIDITYEIKPPRLVCLTLGRLDPRNGTLTRKRFVIRYHDMEEIPDFLVLKQDYDAAMKRQWNCSQRFRSLMNDHCGVQMWWEGQFIKREPYNPQFPECMFLCYLIRWDNGEFDRLSPWDLETIDPNRKPLSIGASVEVLPVEIRMASYMPGIDDWPLVGDRDSESDRISAGISQVMALDIAKHFSAPVDLDRFPTYVSVVKYPMDLRTIKSRLDNRFYRRVAAVKYDVRRIQTNALLFNDPAKSDIVRNSCIITDFCLEIIRKGDADMTALSCQLLARSSTKEIRGNVESSDTSKLLERSSEPLPQGGRLNGLNQKQFKIEYQTEAICFDFNSDNDIAKPDHSRIPVKAHDQKFILKTNQIANEHWPTEPSSISPKGQVSPKFSSFINVDGTKTDIGLTVDGHGCDDDSERENILVPEITKSRTMKNIVDPEEMKCSPKLKPTASISPYALRGIDVSIATNVDEKDIATHGGQHALATARSISRRSRLPIHGMGKDNLDFIFLPRPTPSSFSTLSTEIEVSDGPKNSLDTYFGDKIFCRGSNATIASSIRKQTINSADVNVGYLRPKKILTRELTRLPLPASPSPNHSVMGNPTPRIDGSHIQLRTLNAAENLTRIRKQGHFSSAFSSTSMTFTPVPLAISTPIRMHKKEYDSKTNFELEKPRLPRKQKESDAQSASCSHLSENPHGKQRKNKRRLSGLSVWNIALIKHVAQGSSGRESFMLQEQHGNSYQKEQQLPVETTNQKQLPALESVTRDCERGLDCSERKVEEALHTPCGTSTNIRHPTDIQVAPLTSVFPPRRCEAAASLLKKTLKKEHQAKWSTYRTRSGSSSDNSSAMAVDDRSNATGLKYRPDPLSRSQDALIAEILAESRLHFLNDKLGGGKSEIKRKKGKTSGSQASSKAKKIRLEPLNVRVSIEEIKKEIGKKCSQDQTDNSKKGRKKHPKANVKKRIDKLVSKGANVYQHHIENDGHASCIIATSARKQNRLKCSLVKNSSIDERLALVERILQERK